MDVCSNALGQKRLAAAIEEDGFFVVSDRSTTEAGASSTAITASPWNQKTVSHLVQQITQIKPQASVRVRRGTTYAIRNLLAAVPQIKSLAVSDQLLNIVKGVLGDQAKPVKGTLFDKNQAANWKVPWHQDLAIAVQDYVDVPGFGPWSIKSGTHFVQPPTAIVENMLALRIHLDDCSVANGALKVIPGSHRQGRLSPQQIAQYRQHPAVICEVKAGDLVIMRPLLLHQSSAALQPNHRRVIHLEYAAGDLPGGLRWL